MAKARYSNAFVQNTPIVFGKQANPFGTLLSEYQVSEYWDLRTNSTGDAPMRAYIVSLKQRLTICNSTAGGFAGPNAPDGYSGYPILAVQNIVPATSVQGLQFYLEDYSPKTLNAAVNTSQNKGVNSSDSNSSQHTAGSSTSVTNSYEVSDSVGFFGMDPTGSVSAGFSSSTTDTQERSDTVGASQARGSDANNGNSMSVKDWASYAFLDVGKQQPSWVWGQEYPWNIIDFRASADGSVIDLPAYVQGLLCDGSFLYPPSQISQFGLNFVAHAKWLFYLDGAAGADDETVAFTHNLTYWTGSHIANGTAPDLTVTASVVSIAQNQPIETVTLNLPVLSLAPVAYAGPGNGAVMGFVLSEFMTPPGTGSFRVKSAANNLYVSQGSGFDAMTSDDSVLTASNVTTAGPASLTVQFKVVDPLLELSLHLKHWKTTAAGCVITLVVNGQTITRHIDAMNAGSGADNITTITLRSRDYTSPDYYDYLIMGVNTLTLTITPSDGNATAGYALRALAVQ